MVGIHVVCDVYSHTGHFIVVCGYNKKDKLIYYKNPSYREGKIYVILLYSNGLQSGKINNPIFVIL